LPIAFLAFTNAAMWFLAARRAQAIGPDLEAAWHFIDRHSSRVVGLVALVAAIVSATFATKSAAGADASGYVSQAAAWAVSWPPLYVEPLGLDAIEFDGWITTPLGWRPSPDYCDSCQGVQVPTYPPGLPLLMAVPHAVGGLNGANAVVIATAAVSVWATGALIGGATGILAAALVAFSPVFLHQSIQPMSDVPVTAAWMLCFFLISRRGAFLDAPAGLACALAVLIRPNLAPLAIVPFFLARRRIAFSIPVAMAGMVLAGLQSYWYGSPIRSGYGAAEELFALGNVVPNASRYFNWLLTTAPILFLALIGFWRMRSERVARALIAFAALVVVSYLVYAVFDDWSYLRFLLPAMAVLAVFAAIALAGWLERIPATARGPILFALMLAIVAHGLWIARSKDTFKLALQLQRVETVADYVRANLEPGAVLVAGEQSGSLRYYTARSILRWEAATPATMSDSIGRLELLQRPVYIILDAWEDAPFRSKFVGVSGGALDWPPMLEAGTSHRTRLWRVSDRDRFQAGERLNTIRLP
jgi:hypothetical protein